MGWLCGKELPFIGRRLGLSQGASFHSKRHSSYPSEFDRLPRPRTEAYGAAQLAPAVHPADLCKSEVSVAASEHSPGERNSWKRVPKFGLLTP
jgi:hypothetical protein